MLRDAAPYDRLEVGDIGNVDDLIDTFHEGRHGIVGRETLTEKNNEMLPPERARPPHHLVQDRIILETRALKILVNDDDVVAVGRELEQNVLGKKAQVQLVV